MEAFLGRAQHYRGSRIGLVTNHTAIDPSMTHLIERMNQNKLCPDLLFSPEHGIHGVAEAGERVENSAYGSEQIPINSLYGNTKVPTANTLNDLDLLVYDIQDVGVRFYTYIYTLANVIQAAGDQGLPMIILDRPNPLTGSIVQGRSLPQGYSSFVGDFRLPIRYGLTPGELGWYVKNQFSEETELSIATMSNWKRTTYYDHFFDTWIPPSPNIPTIKSALLYPGTCLLEGTNLSEGRGTTTPLQVLGAPWLQPRIVRNAVKNKLPRGIALRITKFRPDFGKYEEQTCNGLQIHFTTREFSPVTVITKLLWAINETHPNRLQWKKSEGEYFLDTLTGETTLRNKYENHVKLVDLLEYITNSGRKFSKIKSQYHIYPELAGQIYKC